MHEHKELHKRERKNRQILQSKGEISEERKTENEAAQKAYDKLLTNSSTLSVSLVYVPQTVSFPGHTETIMGMRL